MFPTKKGFPCGKCIDCLSKKRNDWSIRLQKEYAYWLSRGKGTYMVLLTYDEDHVPCTSSGTHTLRQKDVQDFLKRLRKALQKDGLFVRIFYCGEYGPSTKRPHYHMLLFGIPLDWTKRKVKDILQKAWKNGFIGNKLGLVTEGGIHYCTKYMINKIIKLDDPECEKPFNRMSKGLGMSYIYAVEEDSHGIHKSDIKSDVERRYTSRGLIDLQDLYEYLFPIVHISDGSDRSSQPVIPPDPDNEESVRIAQTIDHYYRDRVSVNGSRFKLPRYYRLHLFQSWQRALLNYAANVLYHIPKEREYVERYGDYDATHEVPMKILMAQEKTNRLIGKYIKESQI